MLAMLFELTRDLAVFAAALGIARWTWDWHTTSAERRDDIAKAALAEERWRADMRQWAATIDKRIDAALGDRAAVEARADARVRVHKLLQSTDDPYLSFSEIEAALARGAPGAATEPIEDRTPPTCAATSGEGLRRVLIELVGDGVIAQMDRDRYFIASDYETGEDKVDGDR